MWVEKILSSSERLPADWPVTGTVGYEFLNDVCGLFVDPAGEPGMSELWGELSADQRPFAALVEAARAALDGHWPDGIAGGVSGFFHFAQSGLGNHNSGDFVVQAQGLFVTGERPQSHNYGDGGFSVEAL